jgi:predicted anti-sigma-YlaC factor YlaD
MTDERHPQELLAGFVDGSLTEGQRAGVEAHLSTCARCREEAALAMRAVAGLRELPEEAVPVGVMAPVRDEIARRKSQPRRLGQRVLWAAGGAVAAAFVGLLAVWVIPNAGPGAANEAAGRAAAEAASPNATPAPAAGDAGGGAGVFAGAGAPLAVEHSSTNYDDAALRALATSVAAKAASANLARNAASASERGETQSASECLAKGAGLEPQDVLVRLIAARYEKEPAIIGVYLTGPGSDGPPDNVVVWVVRPDTCDIASITSKRI